MLNNVLVGRITATYARRVCTLRSSASVSSTAADIAQRLRSALSYEAKTGFGNSKGTVYFDQFLAVQLAELRAACSEPSIATVIQSLETAAQKYATLDIHRRETLVNDTQQAIDKCLLVDNNITADTSVVNVQQQETTAVSTSPAADKNEEDLLWGVLHLSLEDQLATPFLPPNDTTTFVPILFDCEASDRSARTSHPVEIAAVSMLNGREFETYVKLPDGVEMATGATMTTGITTKEASSEYRPTFKEAYTAFMSFVEDEVREAGENAVPVFIGHNIAAYDLPMILERAKDNGLPLPLNARILDTLHFARHVVRSSAKLPESKSLQKLHAHYAGQEAEVQHRALADVKANEYVFWQLWKDAGFGEKSITEVLLQKRFISPKEWVGSIELINVSRSEQHVKKTRTSAMKSRSQFGLDALSPLERYTPSSTSSVDTSSSSMSDESDGGSDIDEKFSVAAWRSDDPLATFESEARAGDLEPPSFASIAQTHDSWKQLLADPAVTRCFLNAPLSTLKGKAKFTPGQLEDLATAGVNTLVDLLEVYPRGYVATIPGALPSPGIEDEQAICLVVSMGTIRKNQKPGSWAALNVSMRAVHPEVVGLPSNDISSEEYGARDVQLVASAWRPGPKSLWAIGAEEKTWRSHGSTFVLSARVEPSKYDRDGPDTWSIKEGSVQITPIREAAELFASPDPQIRTSYSQRGELSGQKLAGLVNKGLTALESLEGKWNDPLPEWLRNEFKLIGYLDALKGMHAPRNEAHFESARRRLAFQELLCMQLKLLIQRATFRAPRSESDLEGIQVRDLALAESAQQALPYELTNSQKRAFEAIKEAMYGWPPMMCLLQGDVGCGKTAVALLALLATAGSGYQAALMAPTEILAEQHFQNLNRLIDATMTREDAANLKRPRVALLTGSLKKAERTALLTDLASGEIDIVVGTHALVSDGVDYAHLGLAVIDEQHKFGVGQRAKLLAKGPCPHVLTMSATPIPRSLALAAHGEMTLITIDEMPPGRKPVETHVVPDEPTAREGVYNAMRASLAAGGQVYIVCPLVGNDKGADKSTDGGPSELKAAVEERQRLVADGVLEEGQCGLLHGRMTSEEKEAAVAAFSSGETPVLISTTVVEVGVDVPAASVMIVEHAERFGLAQLHQLRGRVGRAGQSSSCYLFASGGKEDTRRLRVLEKTSNGFAVAEADYEHRGFGELLGKRQSGKDLASGLKACRLPGDEALLEAAREAAAQLMDRNSLPQDWSVELLAAVADPALLIDLAELPTLK